MATDIKSIVEGAARAVGTAVGTAAGVAAGAAQAIVGKASSKNAGPVDPMTEELYWREHFAGEPYFDGSQFAFDDYLPAWQTGWEGKTKYAGQAFADVERDLEQDWNWNRGKSRLLWQQARDAVRAAFERTT